MPRPALEKDVPVPGSAKIRIEKGIPLPKRGRSAADDGLPWMDMEPGNSFWVPISFDGEEEVKPDLFMKRMQARAKAATKRLQYNPKFTCRFAPEDPRDTNPAHRKDGVRVWRLPPEPKRTNGQH